MQWSKWVVVGLAVFQGAWMTFDGGRALIVGNYVTPTSGPGAGQLGPWSRVISAIGLEPRSALVKWLHIALGIAWLASAAALLLTPSPGWWAILVCAVCTLWYLPIGTVVAIIEIGLLLLLR